MKSPREPEHEQKDQLIHKFHIIVLLALTLIGFFLRIYNLDHYSFWNDEVITIIASEGVLSSGVPVMPEGTIYFKSPLHVYSVAAMINIFGVSEFSTRIISVIFGTLTIILIYIVGKKLSDNNKIIGISAALIYTFSLWSIAWSREARFYQQFQFMSLLTIYMFWLGYVRTPSVGRTTNVHFSNFYRTNKYIILSILCFILAMLTSKLAIIIIPPLVLVMTIKKGFKYLIMPKFSISLAIMVGIWLFYQAMPVIFSFDTKNPLLETDIIGFELASVYQNLVGFGFFLLANFVLAFFIIFGIFMKKWRKTDSFRFLYSYFFICSIILIFLMASPIFRSRYYYFLFPIMIILVCISAHYFSTLVTAHFNKRHQNSSTKSLDLNNKPTVDKSKSHNDRTISNPYIFVIFIAIILISNSNIFFYQSLTVKNFSSTPGTQPILGLSDIPLHPDYKGCCEYIQDNYLIGDCILVKRERPVEFYLNEYLEKKDITDYLVIGFYNLSLTDLQNIFNTYRVWVVIDEPVDSLIPRFITQEEYDFIESNTEIYFESEDQYTYLGLENK